MPTPPMPKVTAARRAPAAPAGAPAGAGAGTAAPKAKRAPTRHSIIVRLTARDTTLSGPQLMREASARAAAAFYSDGVIAAEMEAALAATGAKAAAKAAKEEAKAVKAARPKKAPSEYAQHVARVAEAARAAGRPLSRTDLMPTAAALWAELKRAREQGLRPSPPVHVAEEAVAVLRRAGAVR